MPPPPTFTEDQLARLRANDYGRHAGTVRRLIDELIAANTVNRALADQCVRQRMRVEELERAMKPIGRLLLVDVPANEGDRCEWETIIYHDLNIDLRAVRCPVGTANAAFDALLGNALKELPSRFQRMPWEISGCKSFSIPHWPRDTRREVEALIASAVDQQLLDTLNQIKDERDEAERTTQKKGATEAQPAAAEEQIAGEARADAPRGPLKLPW